MKTKTIIRKQGIPQWRDLLNSAYYAVVIPVLVKVQEVLSTGALDFNWKDLGTIALGALVGHLIRKATEKPKKVEITPLKEKKDVQPHPPGVPGPKPKP